MIKYNDMKEELLTSTMCGIQHNGWTCGSCFFAIDDRLTNRHWQCILYFRGDYKSKDLDNMPKNVDEYEKVIKEIYEIIKL
tara:strand:- start:202 stop:444 length:243 start_codon:yes stop_codon:yes gene_type:complete